MVAPIELSLRVKGEKELKSTKKLIDQVEKAVGKLNKVKITFDTSKAEQSLQRLKAEIKKAEGIAGNFFGDSKIRSGIGAFSAKTGEARKEIKALRVALGDADSASERMKFALQTLSGEFKVARLEGQAFAKASAKFFDEGLGSLNVRLREIEKLPKTLFASSEAIKELTFMQSMAVDGTEEFVRVNAALGRQLEINAGLLERAARAQKPFGAGMSMVPPGLQRPALPAAGQTSGSRQLTTDAQKTAVAFVQAATASETFSQNLSKAAADASELPEIFNIVSKSLNTLSKGSRAQTQQAKKASKARGNRTGSIISSALIGGGFPLLFGGGPLSAIGGAAGGGIGGAIGGAFGFAGGIVGTAIGQNLERAAEAANQFALEATKASTSLSTLITGFGIAGTGTAASLNFAATLGLGGTARAAAQGSLAGIVGEEGVKSLEKLAESAEDASNAINRFGAATSARFAPVLTLLNQTVTGLFGGISPSQELDALTDPKNQPSKVLSGPGAAARQQFQDIANKQRSARIAELSENPEVKKRLDLEKQISKVEEDRKQLAADSARVEGIRLTARRDSFAAEQGNLQVKAQQNKLDIIEIELLNGELTPAKRRELNLEKEITGEAIKQAKAAKANAVLEAKRQIQREQISSATNQIRAIRQEQRLELEYQQTKQGRFTLFKSELEFLNAEFASNALNLELDEKRALIGKNEPEAVASIKREYALKLRILEDEFALNEERLKQQKAEYDLGRLQVRQALDLQKVQAGMDARRKIRETSPFERERFLLDPFFGSSRELAANQGANFQEQVARMNFALGQNQDRLNVAGIGPERKKALEDQRAQLELNLALFKEYQPSVDQAALAQARFSDALAITKPVTDDLFDSLLSVVEGTKTAEQAFADFLRSIASILFSAAKSIIAQYLAIGYARLFAFPGSSAGPGPIAPEIQSGKLFGLGDAINTGMRSAASGKGALMNQPYLVGERGPELFVPRNNGTIVPNHQMGAGASVTVNVDASGSSVEGSSNQAAQLGRMLGAAVQAELIKQKRPGGLLAS